MKDVCITCNYLEICVNHSRKAKKDFPHEAKHTYLFNKKNIYIKKQEKSQFLLAEELLSLP